MGSNGLADFKIACPFYDEGVDLCCNTDTATIMSKFCFEFAMMHVAETKLIYAIGTDVVFILVEVNFQQLDGVFKTDSSICAANLKRLWCEYACNANKGDFRK